MASIKYLAPILAAAGYAAAQTRSCSTDATTTLQNSGDATALASCRTYTGTIALATDLAGTFSLDSVERIEGSLLANNATQLTSFTAGALRTITDTFGLESMIRLSTLAMPYLTSVGSIDWSALPALQVLTFDSGLSMAGKVQIENTQLTKLDGINLAKVDELTIANNPLLDRISMQLGNVSDQLTINANGRNAIAEFPNLIWAQNLTINNISSLSIPSLQAVNGSFGMNFNYFSNISAPNLTMIGGSLGFVSNSKLESLDFPELTDVGGGLLIANNSALETIDGFEKLETVGGALDCTGVFSNITFPGLSDVKGAFNVQSTENVTDSCNIFQAEAGPTDVIKGEFTCSTTSSPTSNDGTTTGDGTATTSSGAASALVITGASGLLGVVAAIFGLL